MKPPIPVIALAAAAMLLAGCGGQSPSDDTAASASATSDHHDHGGGPDAPAQPTSVNLGAPVSLTGTAGGEEFEVTYSVTKLDTTGEDDDGSTAATGDIFVAATVEVHAYRGSHPAGPGNGYAFTLLDKKDTGYEPVDNPIGEPLDGTVSAKDTMTGTIVFEVPEPVAEHGRIQLKADGANGGDQTVIWKPA